MRIQCSSFWPSMFTSQSSLNSFSSVKLHSYFCYSEVCPHRFLKSQHARNSCQMSASFRVTNDNLLSQHIVAEQSIHVVLFLIVLWIGKTLCKIQQLHWWEKLLNSTCIVKQDHLLIFPTPYFCISVTVSFLSDRIMQLFRWEYFYIYVRKWAKRERNQELDCVFIQHGISLWNWLLQDTSKDRNSPVLIKPTGLFIKKTYTHMILRGFKSIYFNQKRLIGGKLFFESINLFAKGGGNRYFLLSVFILVPLCVAVFIFSCIVSSSDCCHNHYIRSDEFIPG